MKDTRLLALKHRMLKAYHADKWQELAELDTECQLTVKNIIQEDPRAMFDELREMLGFYADLIANCQVQKGKYAGQVKQLRSTKLHHAAYLEFNNVRAICP